MSEKEASTKTLKEQIIEALAILEHKQWSHWIKYQDRLFNDEEAGYDVWYRWRELAKTKYADLKDRQKESDREWARASFKIVSKCLVAEIQNRITPLEYDIKLVSACSGRKYVKDFIAKSNEIKALKWVLVLLGAKEAQK